MVFSLKALLFDFDGLILDTETPEVQVWQTIYAEHGFEFPRDRFSQIVGGWGLGRFDAADYLHELTHDSLDVEALRTRHKDESSALILRQPVLDGVRDYLIEARRRYLRLVVVSSSPRSWVDSHLARLGLAEDFEQIVCGDDVAPGRTKPHPDIYQKALERLQIKASEAIALEDSPNGVTAARAAGIFVVAVPNPTTVSMKIDGANVTTASLGSLPFEKLLKLYSK